jgi:O-antigen/teichoic acid export membrane protein
VSAGSDHRLAPGARRRAAILNLGFHYIQIGLSIVQGLVLVPLYLAHIPVSLYGGWLATGNILAWLELIDPGIGMLIQQRVAFSHGADDPDHLARVIGTGLTLSLAVSVLPLVAWPFADLVPGVVGITGADGAALASAFRVGLIGTGLLLLAYGVTSVSLGLQMAMTAGIAHTLSGIASIATIVIGLLLGLGLPAIPLGLAVKAGTLIVANLLVQLVWFARVRVRPRFDRAELRALTGLATYTMIGRAGGTLLERMDALLTAWIISPSAAAVLVLTGRVFEIVRLAAGRVAPALTPGLASLAGEGLLERFSQVTRLGAGAITALLAVGLAGTCALNAVFMELWVGPELFGGQALTLAFAAATVLLVMLSYSGHALFAVGAIKETSLLGLGEALLKLPLQWGLTVALGLVGMPLAACIAMVAVRGATYPALLARYLGERRRAQYRFWLGVVALPTGAIAGGHLVHLLVDALPVGWTWPTFAAAAVVVGAVAAVATWALSPPFRQLADRVLARLRRRTPAS